MIMILILKISYMKERHYKIHSKANVSKISHQLFTCYYVQVSVKYINSLWLFNKLNVVSLLFQMLASYCTMGWYKKYNDSSYQNQQALILVCLEVIVIALRLFLLLMMMFLFQSCLRYYFKNSKKSRKLAVYSYSWWLCSYFDRILILNLYLGC